MELLAGARGCWGLAMDEPGSGEIPGKRFLRRKEEEERALAAQHLGVVEGWQHFVQNASLQQGRGVRKVDLHLVERGILWGG